MALYAKPDTLRAANLSDMAELLHTQRARALDVVAPASAIDSRDGLLVVTGTEAALDADGVTPTAGRYRLTETAEGGISDKLAIPMPYLRRMREQNLHLYDQNVNGWLDHNPAAKYLVRMLRRGEEERCPSCGEPAALLASGAVGHCGDENGRACPDYPGTGWAASDGIVRAFLSDRYRIVDNLDVLLSVLQGIRESGVHTEVRDADLTERRMYLKLWAPGVAALAPALLANYRSPFDGGAVRIGAPGSGWTVERARAAAAAEGQGYRQGEEPVLFAGFVVSNSETGHGRFSITPQIVVQICGNGLTLTADALHNVHLGSKLDAGVIRWSEQTQQRNLELIRSQAADAVKTFLDADYVKAKAAELEAQAGAPVAEPAETIQYVAKQLAFSDEQANSILNHFILGGQLTAGGVMQAVSSVAQTVTDGDAANDLEAQAVPAMKLAARVPVGASDR